MLKSFLKKLQKQKSSPIYTSKTSGELISETTNGANLVEGKETWEYAETKKHDLDFMKKCCLAELKTMEKSTIPMVPAPYYFERVAILSRKEKNHQQEIEFCQKYINVVEDFYQRHKGKNIADVRKGPRYKAIVTRLPKAKELLNKQND